MYKGKRILPFSFLFNVLLMLIVLRENTLFHFNNSVETGFAFTKG